MRRWVPAPLYEAKPWILMILGVLLLAGMTAWSMLAGSWTVWRSLSVIGGMVALVVGGALLQLRQEYRATRRRGRRGPPR